MKQKKRYRYQRIPSEKSLLERQDRLAALGAARLLCPNKHGLQSVTRTAPQLIVLACGCHRDDTQAVRRFSGSPKREQ